MPAGRKTPERKVPPRGLSDIRTMGDIATARLSPQAAYMKVASLELEKKILKSIKSSSISRMEGIKQLCEQVDDRVAKITARESTLSTIAMRGVPRPAAGTVTSCKEIFDQMPGRFKKDAAQDLEAVYQFKLS